ncbi:hypothetical protein RCH09_002694 [Actimicrobium sp. GrIS 1.19]|uniref:hypothetical protein n=1 Tax=Actimicrobium sp. GrIS 1.19 TaxID=3071708 RepID=UPI002E0417D0|nr:hypothetical protein [Actimicrobium sp. GrIS 1.19]
MLFVTHTNPNQSKYEICLKLLATLDYIGASDPFKGKPLVLPTLLLFSLPLSGFTGRLLALNPANGDFLALPTMTMHDLWAGSSRAPLLASQGQTVQVSGSSRASGWI